MSQKSKDKELLELGKKLQTFYDLGYINRRQALTFSFLKGAVSGLGAVVGGTVILALLLFMLSKFDRVPLLGPVSDSIRSTIQNSKNQLNN